MNNGCWTEANSRAAFQCTITARKYAFLSRSARITQPPLHLASFVANNFMAITFSNNSKSRLLANKTYICTFNYAFWRMPLSMCVCVYIARTRCCFASVLVAWPLCCNIKCLKYENCTLSPLLLPPLTHGMHEFPISSLFHLKLPLISLLLPLLLPLRIVATHIAKAHNKRERQLDEPFDCRLAPPNGANWFPNRHFHVAKQKSYSIHMPTSHRHENLHTLLTPTNTYTYAHRYLCVFHSGP